MAAPSNSFPFGSGQSANAAPPANAFGFGAPAGPSQPAQPASSFTSLFGQPVAQPHTASAPSHPQPTAPQSIPTLFGQPIAQPQTAPTALLPQPTPPQSIPTLFGQPIAQPQPLSAAPQLQAAAPQSLPTLFGQPVSQPTNAPAPARTQRTTQPSAAPANAFGFGSASAPAVPVAAGPMTQAAAPKLSKPAMLFGKPVGPSGAAADAGAGSGKAGQARAARPTTASGRLFGAALGGHKFPKRDADAAAAGGTGAPAGGAAGGQAAIKSGNKVWQRLAPVDESKAGISKGGGLGSQLAAAAASGRAKTPWGRLARVENGVIAAGAANENKPASTFGFGQQQQQQQKQLAVVDKEDAAMVSPGNVTTMEEDGGNHGNEGDMSADKREGWGLGKFAAASKAFLSGGTPSSSAQASGKGVHSVQDVDDLQRAKQAAMKAILSTLSKSGNRKGGVSPEPGAQAAPQVGAAARGKKNAKTAGGRGKKKASQAAVASNAEGDVDEEELKRQALAQMPTFHGAGGKGVAGGRAASNKQRGGSSRGASDVDDEEEMKRQALSSMPTFLGVGGSKFGGGAKKQATSLSVSPIEEVEDEEEQVKRKALALMPGFIGAPGKQLMAKPHPQLDTEDEEAKMKEQALASLPTFGGGASKPAGMKRSNRRSPSPSPSSVAPASAVMDDEEFEGGIVGTCNDMCSAEEVEQRKQTGQIDSFEMRGNNLVCVKKAQRNFDANMQQPHLFRTMVGLDKSMRYLRKLLDENALSPGSNPFEFLRAYNFLWDRYRSVRKDVTTQAFHKSADKLEQVLAWNEEVARFLILADHELCSLDKLYTPEKANNEAASITDLNAALQVSKYDAHLNSEQLNKTLTDLNTFYDEAKLRGIPCPNEPEIRAYFVMLSAHTHGQFGKTPGQLESYNMKQSDLILSAPIYRLALEIVARMREGNWRGFFNAVLRAPPLLACLASLYFTSVRHVALKVITASFTMGARDLYLEVEEIMDALCLTSDLELEQLCSAHGLAIQDGCVVFSKQTLENPNLMALQKEVQRLTSAFVQKKYEHLPWSRIVTESLPPSLLPHPSAAAHLRASSVPSPPSPALPVTNSHDLRQPPSVQDVPVGDPARPARTRIVFKPPKAEEGADAALEEDEEAVQVDTAPPLRSKRSATLTAGAPPLKQPTPSVQPLIQLHPPASQTPVPPNVPQVAASGCFPPLRPLQLPELSPAPSLDMADVRESPASVRRPKWAVPPEIVAPSPRTAAELARQRQELLLRQQQMAWEQEMARRREEERAHAEEQRLAQEMQALEERARAYFLEKRVRRAVQRWRAALAAKKEELRRRQEASRARCKVSLGIQVGPVQTAQKRSYADVASAAAQQEQAKRSRASASKMWQALGQDKQPANVVPIIGGALSARLPTLPFLCCQMGVWTGLLDAKAGQPVETLQLGLGDWLRGKLSNAPPQGQAYPQVQAGELLTNFSVGGHNKMGRPTRLALSILELCSAQLPTSPVPNTLHPSHALQSCQALLLCSAVEPQAPTRAHHAAHTNHHHASNTHTPPYPGSGSGSPSGWTSQIHNQHAHRADACDSHLQHASRDGRSALSNVGQGQTSADAQRLLSVLFSTCCARPASRPPAVAVLSSRPEGEVGALQEELEEGLVVRGVRERVGALQVMSVHVKEAGAATAALETALRFLVQHMPAPPALLPQHLHQLIQSFLQPHIDFLATKPPAPHLLIHAYNKSVSATAHHIHTWITDPAHGYPYYHLPSPEMVPPDNSCFQPDQLQAAVTAVQQWHLPEYPTHTADFHTYDRGGLRQFGFGAVSGFRAVSSGSSSQSSSAHAASSSTCDVSGLLRARSYVSSLLRTWPAGSSLGALMQKLESAISSMSSTPAQSPAASPTQDMPYSCDILFSEQHIVQELIMMAFESLAAHHTTAVLVPPVVANPGLLELSREWLHSTAPVKHIPSQSTQLVKDQALLAPSSTNAPRPFSAPSAQFQSPVQVTVLPQQPNVLSTQSAGGFNRPGPFPQTAPASQAPTMGPSPVQVTVLPGPAMQSPAAPHKSPPVAYTVLSPSQQQPSAREGVDSRIGGNGTGAPLSVADQALNIKLAWTRSSLNSTLQKVMLSVMEGTQLSKQYNEVLGKLGKSS